MKQQIVTVAGTVVYGDNVGVTAAFITGATASTVEPVLPPPEQSARVSTSHWVTVISTGILVLTHTQTQTDTDTDTRTQDYPLNHVHSQLNGKYTVKHEPKRRHIYVHSLARMF